METKIQQILAAILGAAVTAGIIALIGYAAQATHQEPVNRPAPTTTQEHVYYHEA